MGSKFERTYGKLFKYALSAVNPFKKIIFQAECNIHKFINRRAIEILKNDGFQDAYSFFSDHIVELNSGVVWADQDFKSINHFYSASKKRGLYGHSNALSLGIEYYDKALKHWKIGDIDRAIFFLGAAVHIVQDMTVPQHANIRLLDSHRRFEEFIRQTYVNTPRYVVDQGGYYLSSMEEFIRCNAHTAMKIYRKLKNIRNEEKRFYNISRFILPLAQRTTAGCLLKFYRDTSKTGTRMQ